MMKDKLKSQRRKLSNATRDCLVYTVKATSHLNYKIWIISAFKMFISRVFDYKVYRY